MIHQTIVFDNRYPDASLVSYLHEPYNDANELAISARPAIIICPGGGYGALSAREAEPVALAYLAAGFQAFVLLYSVGERAHESRPLAEAVLAIRYLREHSEEWHIDPRRVFICGFSAGGHLAASAGCLWNSPQAKAALIDSPLEIGRPDGTILAYPVITTGRYIDEESIANLCGDAQSARTYFSLEKQVNAATSPAFIWCTRNDEGVAVQNSLLYAAALAEVGVGFSLHIYPNGRHGLSLCNTETYSGISSMLCPEAAGWLEDSVRWAMEIKNNS